jgi:hypothetical protein
MVDMSRCEYLFAPFTVLTIFVLHGCVDPELRAAVQATENIRSSIVHLKVTTPDKINWEFFHGVIINKADSGEYWVATGTAWDIACDATYDDLEYAKGISVVMEMPDKKLVQPETMLLAPNEQYAIFVVPGTAGNYQAPQVARALPALGDSAHGLTFLSSKKSIGEAAKVVRINESKNLAEDRCHHIYAEMPLALGAFGGPMVNATGELIAINTHMLCFDAENSFGLFVQDILDAANAGKLVEIELKPAL